MRAELRIAASVVLAGIVTACSGEPNPTKYQLPKGNCDKPLPQLCSDLRDWGRTGSGVIVWNAPSARVVTLHHRFPGAIDHEEILQGPPGRAILESDPGTVDISLGKLTDDKGVVIRINPNSSHLVWINACSEMGCSSSEVVDIPRR